MTHQQRLHFGIDFGGTFVKFGLFEGAAGKTVDFTQTPLRSLLPSKEAAVENPPEATRCDLLENIAAAARNFLRGRKPSRGGLSVKGLVADGIVLSDTGAGQYLAGTDLRAFFSRALSIADFEVENDARCFAWGEYVFGAGKQHIPKVMVCLTLGTGVGCAVVMNGALYSGASVLGGALGGHISIDARSGVRCPCGARGCLEAFCSATAMEKIIKMRHPDLSAVAGESVLPAFFALAQSDSCPGAIRNTLQQFQLDLAAGVVNVIHAYGPDVVVIGGGMAVAADIFLPGVRSLVGREAWTHPRGNVKIVAARHSSEGAAIGAAYLPSTRSSRSKL